MTSYCGAYLQRGCVVPAHAMVISFLSGLFSEQSAYSRSSGTCYLGGDGGEQAVAFSRFIGFVGVWTYEEERQVCSHDGNCMKLLRDPN